MALRIHGQDVVDDGSDVPGVVLICDLCGEGDLQMYVVASLSICHTCHVFYFPDSHGVSGKGGLHYVS